MFKRLSIFLAFFILLLSVGANVHYTLIGLENQTVLDEQIDALRPGTEIVEQNYYHNNTKYVPTLTYNETTYACGEQWANVWVEHTKVYRGAPTYYYLDYTGCLKGWSVVGDWGGGWEIEGNETAIVWYGGGARWATFTVEFEDGSYYQKKIGVYVNKYAPAHDEEDPTRTAVYTEFNWFEDHEYVVHSFVSNADMWNDREMAAVYWQMWYNGVENPGYAAGLYGVTLNALIYVNTGAFFWTPVTYGLLEARIYNGQMNDVGVCERSYDSEMYYVSYEHDTIPTVKGFSIMSRPMGCGLAEFTDGLKGYIFIEIDGEILPPWTPYDGPDGPGYIWDDWDLVYPIEVLV